MRATAIQPRRAPSPTPPARDAWICVTCRRGAPWSQAARRCSLSSRPPIPDALRSVMVLMIATITRRVAPAGARVRRYAAFHSSMQTSMLFTLMSSSATASPTSCHPPPPRGYGLLPLLMTKPPLRATLLRTRSRSSFEATRDVVLSPAVSISWRSGFARLPALGIRAIIRNRRLTASVARMPAESGRQAPQELCGSRRRASLRPAAR